MILLSAHSMFLWRNHPLTIIKILSHCVRKPMFCICENKDADQLRGNREADQRLCFRYLDSTIPLLPKSKNFQPLAIFSGCTAWFTSDLVKIQIVGFLTRGLINMLLICYKNINRSFLCYKPHHEKTCFLHNQKYRRV